MANYVGGYAIIDFGGQTISTTAITVPGAYNACLSGKPLVFENVKFDPGIPAVSLFVSSCAWGDASKESLTCIFNGDTFVVIANDDTVVIDNT